MARIEDIVFDFDPSAYELPDDLVNKLRGEFNACDEDIQEVRELLSYTEDVEKKRKQALLSEQIEAYLDRVLEATNRVIELLTPGLKA